MEKIWLKNYPPHLKKELDPCEDANLVSFIEKRIKKFGGKDAIVSLGHTLSFSEVDELSDRFCAFLQHELHIQKGDRVAVQMPNVGQYTFIALGILKAGAVLVNINPLFTSREMKKILTDSEAKVLVIISLFVDKLKKIEKDLPVQKYIVTHVEDLLLPPKKWIIHFVLKYIKRKVPKNPLKEFTLLSDAMNESRKRIPMDLKGEDLACLQYTGGTTGLPKGAMLTHKNILSNIRQIHIWISGILKEEEVNITALPLYHIFAFTLNFLSFLSLGWKNVLIINPKDLKDLVRAFRKYNPTIFTAVNTLFNALNQNRHFKKTSFFLKVCVGGGAAVQPHVAKAWAEITRCEISEGYGLSETSPVVCCNILGKNKIGTIGVPFPSTDIKIIDEKDQEVPLGKSGELCVKGPQVMKGYWRRDKENEACLKDGWFKTGDIAEIDPEGYVRIVDRKKDMISVSGFKVYPNAIEEVLSRHKKILEAACIGVPDEVSGEVPKIFVIPKKGSRLTKKEVEEFCEKNFTNYKRPHYIEFRKELPKSPIGKILRKELK